MLLMFLKLDLISCSFYSMVGLRERVYSKKERNAPPMALLKKEERLEVVCLLVRGCDYCRVKASMSIIIIIVLLITLSVSDKIG